MAIADQTLDRSFGGRDARGQQAADRAAAQREEREANVAQDKAERESIIDFNPQEFLMENLQHYASQPILSQDKYRYIFLSLVLVILLPFLPLIIELLDYYRLALYVEDGGMVGEYISINSFADFLLLGFQSAPYFLMKPWPWESSNPMQLIQSIENVALLLF